MTRFNITLEEGVKFTNFSLKNMIGGEIFVPKLKSYKITDLVKAISNNPKINLIGIRPGEKIHEEMISKFDAINTLEFKIFIILPDLSFKGISLSTFKKNIQINLNFVKVIFLIIALRTINIYVSEIKNLIKDFKK